MACTPETTLARDRASVEEKAYSKVAWRIVPFVLVCYMCAYLDRVNVGFAKLQMLTDPKLSETVKDPLNVGLLTSIPYLAGFIGMVLFAHSSDRTRERRFHLAIPGVLGALGLLMSVEFANDVTLAMIAFTIATLGIMTTVSQFWNLPAAFLSGAAAAAGIAFVNSIGNVSGFVAPPLIGRVKDVTNSTDAGVIVIALCLLVASALVFAVPARVVNVGRRFKARELPRGGTPVTP